MSKVLNKKGFTLIELLVVIAIIGVLSTLAIVALGNARTKARDSKRMSDLKQIATALELYYAENNAYPLDITPGNSLVSPDNLTTYLSKIPSNPTPRDDGDCPDNDYVYTSDGASYSLTTCLGNSVNNLAAGTITYTPSGFISGFPNCGTATDISGNVYDTVIIGTQCWLAKNLIVGAMINGNVYQADANGGIIQKYCYNNAAVNCATDGGMYQWHTVMAFPKICDSHDLSSPCVVSTKHQGICPTGWHVPTLSEFDVLKNFIVADKGEVMTDARHLKSCRTSLNIDAGVCSDSQYTNQWDCEGAGYCSDSQYTDEASCEQEGSCNSVSCPGDWFCNEQEACEMYGSFCSDPGYTGAGQWDCENQGGSCSDPTYTNQVDCENNFQEWTNAVWTIGVWSSVNTWTPTPGVWTSIPTGVTGNSSCDTNTDPRWDYSPNINVYGLDSYGFSFLPAGQVLFPGTFTWRSNTGFVWLADIAMPSINSSGAIRFSSAFSHFVPSSYNKTIGFSVRCLKN